MYLITVEGDFDSAHYLRDYGGKCEALHGHTFRAAVTVKASKLDEIGLAYDFTVLKRQLNEILSRFDHHSLNEVPPFDKINPSSENIAATIYNEIKLTLSGTPVSPVSVEVWESPTSHVIYKPD
jgi:6-pyruvoyltetrahydropterin/6-carboxytetrahydropterin synthase